VTVSKFTWACVGVGWNHTLTQQWTLELGGHPRTGFEDSLMLSRGKFATSNAELVQHIADLSVNNFQRPIATPAQAKEIVFGKNAI